MPEKILGIDLGTTNSLVAHLAFNLPELLYNESDERFTKSSVYFSSSIPIIGGGTKNMNSKFEINNVKRFIGKKFKEINDINTYAYKIVDKNDEPQIVIEKENETIVKSPQEISSLILQHMVKSASKRLSDQFTNKVVIAVPAYFQQNQREATRAAAELAQLDVVRFINEPTAAAVYHIFYNPSEHKRRIFVFDLGGGTFDMSVIDAIGMKIDVVATGGDNLLGGKDFDDQFYAYVVRKLTSEHGFDESGEKVRVLQRLRKKCQDAKHALNTSDGSCEHEMTLDDLCSNQSIPDEILLDLEDFNTATESLFNRIETILKDFLHSNELQAAEFDEVLLVGGSTRLIKIHNLLSGIFDEDRIKKTINPDEAVALGAAIFANSLNKTSSNDSYEITEVLSFSLGIKDVSGDMVIVIGKHASLPANGKKQRTTVEDFQSSVRFEVYEGEDKIAKKNTYLGDLIVDNITRLPKGQASFTVIFEVDNDSLLHFTAIDNITKTEKKIILSINSQ